MRMKIHIVRMKIIHQVFLLFSLSIYFPSASTGEIREASARDYNLHNDTANDIFSLNLSDRTVSKHANKVKLSTLPKIMQQNHILNKEHIEEEGVELFFSASHDAFLRHHAKVILYGPNITNCAWSTYETTSLLYLDCSAVKITAVASEIPENVTHLHFRKCIESNNLTDPVLEHLTQLLELEISVSSVNYVSSKFLHGLVNLRVLRLNGNFLSSLEPLLFQHVPTLHLLDLRGNSFLNLQSVAVSASILSNLTTLELDNNRETTQILSGDFNSLRNTSLEMLSLFGCGIRIVAAEALKPLAHLKGLFLGSTLINRTALNNISSSLTFSNIEFLQLRNLTSVFLGSTFITEELKPFTTTNLSLLDLDSNYIVRLRDFAFPKLKSLKKLRLNNCSLTHISSKAFYELTNLKELFLTQNKLGTIMFRVPGLHVLDLSYNWYGKAGTNGTKTFNLADNELSSFGKLHRFTLRKSNYKGGITPNTFKGLISLERLEISNTYLNHVSQFAFSDLRNLKHLILSSNNLQNLTSMMFVGLGNLTRLYLSHNIIEYISDSNVFQPLASLEFVSLRDNIISRLPDNLFSFNFQLQTVLLSKNILTAWDYDITSRNSSLRVLLLDNNSIDDVTPSMLSMFKHLDTLDLSANPFKCNTCGMKGFRDWILEPKNTTIQKLDESFGMYMCTNSEDINTPILNTTIPEELCWNKPRKTVLIVCLSVMTVMVLLGVFSLYKFRSKLCDIIHSIRNRLNSYREFKISMNNSEVEIERVN